MSAQYNYSRLPFDRDYIEKVIKKASKVVKNHALTKSEISAIHNNSWILDEMRSVARHYEYSDKYLPSIYSTQFNGHLTANFPYFQAFSAVCSLDKPKRIRTPKKTAMAA